MKGRLLVLLLLCVISGVAASPVVTADDSPVTADGSPANDGDQQQAGAPADEKEECDPYSDPWCVGPNNWVVCSTLSPLSFITFNFCLVA